MESKDNKKDVMNKDADSGSSVNDVNDFIVNKKKPNETQTVITEQNDFVNRSTPEIDNSEPDKPVETAHNELDESIRLLKAKVNGLIKLRDKLLHDIEEEKIEISNIKKDLVNESNGINIPNLNDTHLSALDEIMQLLYEENQVLQIKKLNLVRQIMEQQEICNDLRSKLDVMTVT